MISDILYNSKYSTSNTFSEQYILKAACKSKSTIPPLFNGPEVLSFASDKPKLFHENFSKSSNLDDSGISLPIFSSETNLKRHNIQVTPNFVKKVIINLDSSEASGSDYILVVV